MSYEIAYTESALESIDEIPESERVTFYKGIAVLRQNPYHEQSFAIRHNDATYRDIGITPKILITYTVNDALVIVTVVRVIVASLLGSEEE